MVRVEKRRAPMVRGRPVKAVARGGTGDGGGTGDDGETRGDAETHRLLPRWEGGGHEDRLAHLVKHAMRALDRALQSRLARHDVALGHWVFLRVLWEGDGLTQRQLSREAGVMEPTTFAAMKAMEQRGYVVRRQLAGNRRNVHVFLTPKGRAMERMLVPLALQANAIAVRGVPERNVATTRRTLLAMLRNLAEDETMERHQRRSTAATTPTRE